MPITTFPTHITWNLNLVWIQIVVRRIAVVVRLAIHLEVVIVELGEGVSLLRCLEGKKN